MSFVLTLHGEIRWLVALVGLIAIVKYSLGMMRRSEFKGVDRALMGIFTGLLDLNLLFGLVLLFGLGGGLPGFRIEHATTMLLAVIAAHLAVIWRRSVDSTAKFRNSLVVVIVALALVAVGVIRLRDGWLF